MGQFLFHTEGTSDEKRKSVLEKAKISYGMIPNLIAGLAESPEVAEAYMAMARCFVESSLTPEQRHVVWFTANAEHGCEYCMTGHTGMAMMEKIDRTVIETARNVGNYEDKQLEELRKFTLLMIRQRGWASDSEVQTFLDAGYTRRNALDVILGIAHKTISNYSNHIMNTPLDAASKSLAWENPNKS